MGSLQDDAEPRAQFVGPSVGEVDGALPGVADDPVRGGQDGEQLGAQSPSQVVALLAPVEAEARRRFGEHVGSPRLRSMTNSAPPVATPRRKCI